MRTSAQTASARRGFTLLEMVVAMALTMVVFAITLPFVRVQSRALGANAARLDAEQLARYAQRAIDRELRIASNEPGQPLIVYAGPMGVAFTANILAPDTSDPDALTVEAGADSTLTESWRTADAEFLPLTTETYPVAQYRDARGDVSRKETVMFFLRPDTITGRSDVYVLYRRVNGRDSVPVVRGVHVPPDSAFFTYYRTVNGSLVPIAANLLPLFWDDSAAQRISAVGIRAGGFVRGRSGDLDLLRTVHWTTVLVNAVSDPVCTAPTAPSSVVATKDSARTFPSGADVGTSMAKQGVRVSWNRSPADTLLGSVRSYEIARQVGSEWRVVGSVPARAQASYRHDATLPLLTAGSAVFSVRALGCGALGSTRASSTALTLP